jgi:release factor glutamine methyltransferase
MPGSLQQIQAVLAKQLAQHSDTPELEVQVLLAYMLGKPRAWVLAHPEVQLDSQQREILTTLAKRRMAGEPFPYILGRWEFFGLEFFVTPAVLIPRPETELLVEQALAWLGERNQYEYGNRYIADVGTGTGCIAITLATRLPHRHFVALDISSPALEVARTNIQHHQVEAQVQLVQGNLLQAFAGQVFDLICANLPYIPSQALKDLAVFGNEPTLALDGGPDGLYLVGQLLGHAHRTLAPGGLLLLEIEAGQGLTTQSMARNIFPQARVSLHTDLAGHDRLVAIHNN